METTQTTPSRLQPQSQPPRIFDNSSKMWYVLGGIAIATVVVGLLFVLQKPPLKSSAQQQIITPTVQLKPTLPRSKTPGIITSVVTSTALDAQGNAAGPSSSFLKTDKTIYLVLIFNNPKVGTKFEYIRYLNNKFLDNGSLKIMKPNLTNASFVWSLKKPGATHLPGNYRVKVYTNGIFEQEVSYTVQ